MTCAESVSLDELEKQKRRSSTQSIIREALQICEDVLGPGVGEPSRGGPLEGLNGDLEDIEFDGLATQPAFGGSRLPRGEDTDFAVAKATSSIPTLWKLGALLLAALLTGAVFGMIWLIGGQAGGAEVDSTSMVRTGEDGGVVESEVFTIAVEKEAIETSSAAEKQ